MSEASKVIYQISETFKLETKTVLSALEHFDYQYAMAINYSNKSDVLETPKAVLLIDVAAHNPIDLKLGIDKINKIISKTWQEL